MDPIIRNVDTHFSSHAGVPSVIIRIDRPLLVVGAPQQLLVFVLLREFVRRDVVHEVMDQSKTEFGFWLRFE